MELDAILIPLKRESVLTKRNVDNIRANTATKDQIDALLGALRRKSAAQYEKFMEVLEKHQQRLYEKIEAIERECGYQRKGKVLIYLINFFL